MSTPDASAATATTSPASPSRPIREYLVPPPNRRETQFVVYYYSSLRNTNSMVHLPISDATNIVCTNSLIISSKVSCSPSLLYTPLHSQTLYHTPLSSSPRSRSMQTPTHHSPKKTIMRQKLHAMHRSGSSLLQATSKSSLAAPPRTGA